jgi:4-carboxymuconolactone decarboxylase
VGDPRPEQVYREVMVSEPREVTSPFERAEREFLFGQVWPRAGLSRRERRLVTLACVSAADAPTPIEDHVYAALASGDLSLREMQEFVLQFAVYCGWPKASHVEGVLRAQWARWMTEQGEQPARWPDLDNENLGDSDWEARVSRGEQEFRDVNCVPAPPRDTPYTHAGILSFVFGHVWQRPGLTRRERRIITIACVGIDDSPTPLSAHTGSALESGDISVAEMNEIILQFAAYYGFAKAEAMQLAARRNWERITTSRASA